MTPVDAMDTLNIMGFHDKLNLAKYYVLQHLDFAASEHFGSDDTSERYCISSCSVPTFAIHL
jgi:hypothetical protein